MIDKEYIEAEKISYIVDVIIQITEAWRGEAIDDFRYKRIMIELANQIIFEKKKEAEETN